MSPRHLLLAAAAGSVLLSGCQTPDMPRTTPVPFATTAATDPFIYMEDADSKQALDWARAENARSFAVLQGDPRYPGLYQDALAVVTAKDRVPDVALAGDATVRNFWQDQSHVRGIWRQVSLAGYRAAEPAWTTLLDVDALSTNEKANWVWKGVDCLLPDQQRCLIKLSDGGKDADTLREFDVRTRTFVADGFVSPESKQGVDWFDADTVYIGRDWGPGTLTASGYPYIIKEWKRGTPLASAREMFRGVPSDVSVQTQVLRDASGRAQALLVVQGISFFESRKFLMTASGPQPLPFPLRADLTGLVDGQVVLALKEDDKAHGMLEGDLVSFDLAALKANAATARATLVLRPAANESLGGMATTRDRLVVTLYRDVKGTLVTYAHNAQGWSSQPVAFPADGSVEIDAAADGGSNAVITTLGFLSPTQQWLVNVNDGRTEKLKSLPARFDASNLVVEQQWAVSTDGTRVPYFIVRQRDLKFDGTAPTLLYAYGGFQISETPFYSSTMGKLWLERGGVVVVANIRGGGEFGPRWHREGLKENRQKVFDDFFAVANSLLSTHVTSPRRLGIMGGSNGGLLMGVALTQHPELFNAVVVQVPLLDMLRYTGIGAGASWVGEYGDPAIPAQREYIARYSPYQQLRAGVKYPEPFFETSTKDDRVHPAHARKMAARMQQLGDPFLYYENIDGGHAADANLNERALRSALEYTYLAQKLMP